MESFKENVQTIKNWSRITAPVAWNDKIQKCIHAWKTVHDFCYDLISFSVDQEYESIIDNDDKKKSFHIYNCGSLKEFFFLDSM